VKTAHLIAAEFRERIARGDLVDGESLPVESELIERFGVSKGIVREALRILETEGLVEVRRGLGGGPRVRHPSISQAAMGMGVYLQIGDVFVDDVWQARDRIIAAAVERLASERDGHDVTDLELAVATLQDTYGEVDGYYSFLLDVGELAVAAAGNRTEHVLVTALRQILAVELETATQAVVDVERAIAIAKETAVAWNEAMRNIRFGHARAARQAYERQADGVRKGLAEMFGVATVVDVFADT
jgi:GntR family transcriptional regulator, transcriptional repressor for pyruvate dehydrogenase complex